MLDRFLDIVKGLISPPTVEHRSWHSYAASEDATFHPKVSPADLFYVLAMTYMHVMIHAHLSVELP